MFAASQIAGPVHVSPKNVKSFKKTTVALNTSGLLKAIPVRVGRLVYIEAAILAKSGTTLGFFLLKAAARNVAGTTSLLGTASLVSLRDGTELTVTVAANNTNDTLEISGTSAVLAATDFNGKIQITDIPFTPVS